ncbi:MAG TPA: hypothetical protein VF698_04600 [Thermoanaerobaculia bacterium]
MVDNTNPTNQFHQYQPVNDIPQSESLGGSMSGGLGGMLRGGLGSLSGLGGSARTYAKNNGSLVLGGLAALAIGAGLMRRRGMSR